MSSCKATNAKAAGAEALHRAYEEAVLLEARKCRELHEAIAREMGLRGG